MNWFGLLNCDKPAGITSRDLVNVVQRRLRKIKVGHAGTLDPMATGVLVLGIGPAARLVPYVQKFPKHYRGTFRLGCTSPSGDTESEIEIPAGLREPMLAELQSMLPQLTGRITQTPSAYSAIHIDGKRAYQRIRAGETFQMPSRQVDIHELQILRYEYPELELDVVCGTGTYIRSLGVDLARAVGSDAVMTQLRRLSIGPFHEQDAISIEQLREHDLQPLLVSPLLAVNQLQRVVINAGDERRLRNGLPISAESSAEEIPGDVAVDAIDTVQEAAAVNEQGVLCAIVQHKQAAWYPARVFPLCDSATS
jgi:tRNA pseudouridine55 synthase